MSAADYIEMQQERGMLVRAMDARIEGFDALILPTTPIVAPRIAEVATPEAFAAKNMILLRNTSLVNFFDLCAISLPLRRGSGLPVGLMLAARNGADWRLLRIAMSIERLLATAEVN
jgi:aspartyl-tRNA(Asn)/glutamyl-tRNA(Gln) amidotransferase subunit A